MICTTSTLCHRATARANWRMCALDTAADSKLRDSFASPMLKTQIARRRRRFCQWHDECYCCRACQPEMRGDETRLGSSFSSGLSSWSVVGDNNCSGLRVLVRLGWEYCRQTQTRTLVALLRERNREFSHATGIHSWKQENHQALTLGTGINVDAWWNRAF